MLRIFCALLLLACLVCGTLLSAEETKAPGEMTTKVFKLPFNFMELGMADEPAPAAPEPSSDPFAVPSSLTRPSPPVLALKSSRKILEANGVTFPPGASAIFDPVTLELTLHNTPEMLELTGAFISSILWEGNAPTLAFTVTLVEGPGEAIRRANAAGVPQHGCNAAA